MSAVLRNGHVDLSEIDESIIDKLSRISECGKPDYDEVEFTNLNKFSRSFFTRLFTYVLS